jgi:thymidylate synthase (FAD)
MGVARMFEPKQLRVLDHGFVALTAVMGDDRTPAQCARTSFSNAGAERTAEEDARLTRYLVRNRHTTPLEFCQLRFYIKCPMFVGEQILRHRTASINKISYRYVEARPEFYVPEYERMVKRPENVKQGSGDEQVDSPLDCSQLMHYAYREAHKRYTELLKDGLAPEIARTVLPAGTYTEFYWQQDLHNFMHFLGLRLDSHAQWETRQYAESMLQLARPHFPTAISAWEELNGTR